MEEYRDYSCHERGMSVRVKFFALLIVALFLTSFASASLLPFGVDESSQYLVIGKYINGTAVQTSNYELGANTNAVPSPVDPTLVGNVPDLPSNAAGVFEGIGNNGNLAVTDGGGTFELSNVNVYADIGIRAAGPNPGKIFSDVNKSSGSYFNPHTTNGLIDDPVNSGVTYNYDHSALMTELNTARDSINLLGTTDTLVTGGLDVKADNQAWLTSNNANLSFSGETFVYTASSGLNVVNIDTGGSDFNINNVNFVIQGGSDTSVIFILDEGNMLVTQANMLVGDAGIGYHDVLFFNGQDNNDTQFNFSKTILSGIAYWSDQGSISVDNAQGCTQLIGQTVDMNDVRLGNCAYVPEPTTLALLGLGGLLLRRRK